MAAFRPARRPLLAAALLAAGALERPMPVPGWTLPGVMTAGAAQILLKGSGVLAGRAVLAGSGPLLYLVAAQMVRAGVPPLANSDPSIIDGSSKRMPRRTKSSSCSLATLTSCSCPLPTIG